MAKGITIMNFFMFCAVLLYCLLPHSWAHRLEHHSFRPPFSKIDNDGERIVGWDWRSHGVTKVKKNFVRLTPDRQSKSGGIYSRLPILVDEVAADFIFRISGQGKHFFGDGLAFWVTTQRYLYPGSFHGMAEKFQGLAVIFDTFHNTEMADAHRDVTVVVNDGDQTIEQMYESVAGCTADARYYEGRGDFSVYNTSRAHITVNKDQMVEVWIDAKNSGAWSLCTRVDLQDKLGMTTTEFLKSAYVGFTATTGQLADNHDVLALAMDTDTALAPGSLQPASILAPDFTDMTHLAEDEEFGNDAEEPVVGSSEVVQQDGSMEATLDRMDLKVEVSGKDLGRSEVVMATMQDLLARLAALEHELDHKFAQIEDHIEVTSSSLQKQEQMAEKRIEALEQKLGVTIDQSLKTMNEDIGSKIGGRMSSLEERLEDTVGTVLSTSGGWKLPFLVLLVLLGLAGFFIYKKYTQLRKQHLL